MELVTKTQLEQDLDALLENINTAALAASATAQTLNNAHAAFWGLPDDRLIAVLNSLGAEKVQSMFDEHFAIASACNAFMDAAAHDGVRAITIRGREIAVDANGVFSLSTTDTPSAS